MKDYYEILGVPRNATQEDIKKAYRKLAHQYHPDKTSGDEKKFKEVNEAYQILGNEQKRAQYDRFGTASGQGQGNWGQGDFDYNNFSQEFGNFDFSDIFEEVFGFGGGPGARRGAMRGRDISVDIELPFQEAVFGIERRLLIQKIGMCPICNGDGKEPGTEVLSCTSCNGSGTVRETRRSLFGSFTQLRQCSTCHGRGEVPKTPCKECRGAGVMRRSEEIIIDVPAGINDGEMIKLPGKGEATPGGVSGDLYAKIHVLPHPSIKRDGFDLLTVLPTSLSDAILGITQEIETLDGKISVQIPAGSDSGDVLKVRGRGVPRGRNGRGDFLIKVLVKTPKKLSRKAKQLIEELKKEGL
jgi:molecular chaperone DnaJ